MRVFPGISVVTLGVRNVERATIFYESLGWRASRQDSSTAASFFRLNNLVLELRPSDVLARSTGLPGIRDTGLVVLGQNYGGVHAATGALKQAGLAGGALLRPLGPQRGGHIEGSFADPDGHVWSVVFDPRRPPAPDGSVSLAP
jgi:catechol 2,3-dioxygenase-like lactoylglutathione lyase family enzyme